MLRHWEKRSRNRNAKALELLPKLLLPLYKLEKLSEGMRHVPFSIARGSRRLVTFAAAEKITPDKSGAELTATVVRRICACSWNPSAVGGIVSVLRDLPIPEDELQPVVKKIFQHVLLTLFFSNS